MLLIRRIAGLSFLLAHVVALGACNSHPFTAIEVQPFVEKEDVVEQIPGETAAVDVLFIVDNSGSMEEEQVNLRANFQIFIDAVVATRADFRIAVISTDMSDPSQSGRFLAKPGNPTILVPTTPNLRDVFSENARLGTMGDGFEKGLQAMETALSEPLLSTANAGFLRPGAVLGVVLLSDEEDCSHPPGAIPEFDGDECVRNISRMTPVQHYVDFLRRLKNNDAGKIFYAAITGPDLAAGQTRADCASNAACPSGRCSEGKCCPANPELTECRSNDDCAALAGTACYGRKCLPDAPQRPVSPRTCSCFAAGTGLSEPCTRYIDMVRAFGSNGIFASICASDWAKSLREIAGLAVDLICKFPLSTTKLNPNVLADSARDILVKVNGQELAVAGWNYNCPEPGSFAQGSISFDSASCPAVNSTMQFIYEPAPDGGTGAAIPCGARAGGAACATGMRCGNCNYCERAP